MVSGIPFNIEKSFSFEFAAVGQRADHEASEIELDVELSMHYFASPSRWALLRRKLYESSGNRSIFDNLLRTNLESYMNPYS